MTGHSPLFDSLLLVPILNDNKKAKMVHYKLYPNNYNST